MRANGGVEQNCFVLYIDIYMPAEVWNKLCFGYAYQRSGDVPNDLHLRGADDVVEDEDVWVKVCHFHLGGMQVVVGVVAMVQPALETCHHLTGLKRIEI